MYINDTHIGFYLIFAIIGLFVGQFVDWMNKRLPENKKVFSTDIFREYKIKFRPNYILMILTSSIYVGLIYKFGIKDTVIGNLNLVKYSLLVPMILSACVIDYKFKIIPDRLNLTIFEIGIIIMFLYGFSNIAIAIDLLLGMLIGGGVFFIIAFIGNLIFGKEAMGFGDVKFVTALGLYFGFSNIIIISITSFLIGAIVGVFLMFGKIKKAKEYIPFGPFIVISTFISIFIPAEFIINTLKIVFTLGLYNR